MSHALAEFAPNTIVDFNSNCSRVRRAGHSAYGWIEYRISEDGGRTYSAVKELPYSKKAILQKTHRKRQKLRLFAQQCSRRNNTFLS